MDTANSVFDSAKADKDSLKEDYDAAVKDASTALDTKKGAWTAAGLDVNDASFNDVPPPKDGDG